MSSVVVNVVVETVINIKLFARGQRLFNVELTQCCRSIKGTEARDSRLCEMLFVVIR